MAPDTTEGQKSHRRARPTRFVVWSATDQHPPATLLALLDRRGIAYNVVGDAPSVMAEMARRDGPVVVVQQPQPQPRLAELLAAMRQYYPKAAMWQYQGDDTSPGRLTRLPEPTELPPVDPLPARPAKLRASLLDENPNDPPAARTGPDTELTSEELALLTGMES